MTEVVGVFGSGSARIEPIDPFDPASEASGIDHAARVSQPKSASISPNRVASDWHIADHRKDILAAGNGT